MTEPYNLRGREGNRGNSTSCQDYMHGFEDNKADGYGAVHGEASL